MKLSLKEYDAMQSGWRKWINEHMEISGFKAWGMDFAGRISWRSAAGPAIPRP